MLANKVGKKQNKQLTDGVRQAGAGTGGRWWPMVSTRPKKEEEDYRYLAGETPLARQTFSPGSDQAYSTPRAEGRHMKHDRPLAF